MALLLEKYPPANQASDFGNRDCQKPTGKPKACRSGPGVAKKHRNKSENGEDDRGHKDDNKGEELEGLKESDQAGSF
jgi:hypothetical protein